MSMMMEAPDPHAKYGTCPRCGNDTLRFDEPALNALSRADNRTYVCSDCGTSEGLVSLAHGAEQISKDRWVALRAATLFVGD